MSYPQGNVGADSQSAYRRVEGLHRDARDCSPRQSRATDPGVAGPKCMSERLISTFVLSDKQKRLLVSLQGASEEVVRKHSRLKNLHDEGAIHSVIKNIINHCR